MINSKQHSGMCSAPYSVIRKGRWGKAAEKSLIKVIVWRRVGFPGSSVGKESACNAGDPSSIPQLGRYPGEGIGYRLQYSWASPVAQMVKNLPTLRETWVFEFFLLQGQAPTLPIGPVEGSRGGRE